MPMVPEFNMNRCEALLPDYYYADFAQISFKSLRDRGVRNLLIDVDNTIAQRKAGEVSPEYSDIIGNLMREDPPWRICLVSNIIFGSHRYRRVEKIAGQLKVPFVAAYFFNPKPGPRPFLLGMEKIDARPDNTAMIGDQLFTDVLGGNRLGLVTVLVKPMGSDHWATALLGRRKKESAILSSLNFNSQGERRESPNT